MDYIFNILSADSEDFFLQIIINEKATFFEFHKFIQAELGYDNSQMATFYSSNDDWEKINEIPLLDMETNKNLMEETIINKIAKNKKDKLLYVFDLFSERAFFISLLDIKENKIKTPKCIQKKGNIPEQIIISSKEINFNDYIEDDDIKDEFDDIQFEDIDDYDF